MMSITKKQKLMKAVIDSLKKGEKTMNQMIIKFQNPEEVLDFVNKVAKYPYDMDMKRGRFVVDAKSILGIMNLGFNHPIELKIYDEDCEDLKQEISKYAAA